MKQPADNNLVRLQRYWLNRYEPSACVGSQCHGLSGLDDDPKEMDTALSFCKVLVSQGIAAVIAALHQLGACITEAFDMIERYRAQALAHQVFGEELLALVDAFEERTRESRRERSVWI